MFINKGYQVGTIGECASDIRYGTSSKASETGSHTYLRMNNITDNGMLDLSDVKHITLKGKDLDNSLVRKGDVLFNRTNSREKVGKTCVFELDTPMVIAGYIIRIRPSKETNGIYLSTYMNLSSVKKMLRAIAKGAVHQANINSKELAAIEIPLPPLSLQQEFAAFVTQVDKLRFAAC